MSSRGISILMLSFLLFLGIGCSKKVDVSQPYAQNSEEDNHITIELKDGTVIEGTIGKITEKVLLMGYTKMVPGSDPPKPDFFSLTIELEKITKMQKSVTNVPLTVILIAVIVIAIVVALVTIKRRFGADEALRPAEGKDSS